MFPKSVKLLGVEIPIIIEDIGDDYQGYYDSHTKTIHIDINEPDKHSILFHELMHAALEISKLTYVLNNEYLEEAIIRLFESCFAYHFKLKKVNK